MLALQMFFEQKMTKKEQKQRISCSDINKHNHESQKSNNNKRFQKNQEGRLECNISWGWGDVDYSSILRSHSQMRWLTQYNKK